MKNDDPILIVDDQSHFRVTVKNILLGSGYSNIHLAVSGRDALDKTRDRLTADTAEMFKVIFLDWTMPEMNGFDFLRTLRSDLKLDSIAVLMLTAVSDQKSIMTALKEGATSYIVKPASTEVIKKKMSQAVQWLDSRQATP